MKYDFKVVMKRPNSPWDSEMLNVDNCPPPPPGCLGLILIVSLWRLCKLNPDQDNYDQGFSLDFFALRKSFRKSFIIIC